MNKLIPKLILVLVIVGLIASFFIFDLAQYLNLDYLKEQKTALTDYYELNRALVIAIYFITYVAMAALSLPGAAILTLAGGAIFGFVTGTIVVSFASTIGATFAFLVARYLLGDYVQKKFKDKLKKINREVEKDGAFYLFTLRLVPLFPFWLINLMMGLTPMKVIPYFIVSQIGMLAGTMVYVNAGKELSKIESLKDILSPTLIGSFILLGIFPLLTKKLILPLSKKCIKFIKGQKS